MKKILLVEDEIDISEVYKIKLEKEGYIVDVAYDGFNALTKAVTFLPDLILLDIMMPNMDGFESLNTIRNLAPSLKTTKIIIFSNLSSDKDIQKAMDSGADGYFVKSNITPSELIAKINGYFIDEYKHNDNIIYCPHCNKEIDLTKL